MHFFHDDKKHYEALRRSLFIYAKLNPVYPSLWPSSALESTLAGGRASGMCRA